MYGKEAHLASYEERIPQSVRGGVDGNMARCRGFGVLKPQGRSV